jgi:hypothetical protein
LKRIVLFSLSAGVLLLALIAKQQLDLMKSLGLSHSDEIAATLIRSGEMLTSKIREVNASDMEDDIKK